MEIVAKADFGEIHSFPAEVRQRLQVHTLAREKKSSELSLGLEIVTVEDKMKQEAIEETRWWPQSMAG